MNNGKKFLVRTILISVLFLVLALLILSFCRNCKRENTDIRYIGSFAGELDEDLIFSSSLDRYTLLFYLRVKTEQFFDREAELPFTEKMDIELVDKNSCMVYLYGKALIGCVEVMQQYMYFDREGMVTDCSRERIEGIPLIKGIDFDQIVLGEKLPAKNSFLIETISEISMLLKKNQINVADITFSPRYDVTLHIDDDEILLGKDGEMDIKIDNLSGILKGFGAGPYIFDMREYSENSRTVTARPVTY